MSSTSHVNFEIYLKEILRRIYPDQQITDDAKRIISDMLNDVLDRLIVESTSITKYSKRKTIDENMVSGAVDIIFPGELARYAKHEGNTVVMTFKENDMKQ